MRERVRDFIRTNFSRLSLSIIIFETLIISGLVYLFVPVGQVLKAISGLFGTILSVLVAIRIFVWFYREINSILADETSKEAGQLEMEDSTSRPIEDALQTTNERFDEQVSKVTDWMNINEHGDITLIPKEDIADDPKFLLYVIAAKVAHELGMRETSRVSYDELSKQVATRFPVSPFLSKAEQFLNFYHQGESVGSWSEIPHRSRDETEVEINKDQIEEAIGWVKDGSRNVPRRLEND